MTPARSNGKHPGGRPSKYDPTYGDRLLGFFRRQHSSASLVTLLDFAESVGVTHDCLDDWQQAHPEFLRAVKTAMRFQERQLCHQGLRGQWNPAMCIFLLKNNHGYKDRVLVNGTGGGGDTHYHYTVNIQAADEELAKGILASVRARSAPAAV